MDHKLAKQRAYCRAYYQRNLEKMRARGREYARKNAEKHKASARKWNQENKQRYKENLLRWRKENPGRQYELTKKYWQTDLGQAAIARATAARRSREKGSVRTLTAIEWSQILIYYGHSCAYCHRYFPRLTKDHIVPLSKGGHHTKENVAPACRSCNSRKRTRLISPSRAFPQFLPG